MYFFCQIDSLAFSYYFFWISHHNSLHAPFRVCFEWFSKWFKLVDNMSHFHIISARKSACPPFCTSANQLTGRGAEGVSLFFVAVLTRYGAPERGAPPPLQQGRCQYLSGSRRPSSAAPEVQHRRCRGPRRAPLWCHGSHGLNGHICSICVGRIGAGRLFSRWRIGFMFRKSRLNLHLFPTSFFLSSMFYYSFSTHPPHVLFLVILPPFLLLFFIQSGMPSYVTAAFVVLIKTVVFISNCRGVWTQANWLNDDIGQKVCVPYSHPYSLLVWGLLQSQEELANALPFGHHRVTFMESQWCGFIVFKFYYLCRRAYRGYALDTLIFFLGTENFWT